MEVKELFTLDPCDKLLAKEEPNLNKSNNSILKDLDKI